MTLAVLLLLQSNERGENDSTSKHSNLRTLVTLSNLKSDKMACWYNQLWISLFYRIVWCWNKHFIYLCFFWSFQKTQVQYAVSTIFSGRDRDFDDQSPTNSIKSRYPSPLWALLLTAIVWKSTWLIMTMIPSMSDEQVHGFFHSGSERILTSQ